MFRMLLLRLRNRLTRLRLKGRELHPLAQSNLTALDHLNLSEQARVYRYVVIDLETTGLEPSHDHVLSIGAFRVVNGRVRLGDSFAEMVNPCTNIPHASIKIHNIVPDMVAEARPLWDVLDDFLAFLGVDVVVAHHARFDLHFLNIVMRRRHGFPLQNLTLDTALLCRAIAFPRHAYPYGIDLEHRAYSLDGVARHFDIEIHERHSSLGDALATAMVFQRILSLIEKTGGGRLSELVRVGAVI